MKHIFTLILFGLVFMQLSAQQIMPSANGDIQLSESSDAIRLSPNPSTDQLHLTFADKMMGNTIRIYNLLGSEIAVRNISSVQEQIDFSSAQAGLYIYRIIDRNNKTLLSGKFNKQ